MGWETASPYIHHLEADEPLSASTWDPADTDISQQHELGQVT